MPETTVTKSVKTTEGSTGKEYNVEQYTTTIPKALAEAMDFDGGEKINWKVESGSKLSLTKADD